MISSLTMDALYGYATGSVTLNGTPLSDEIFKQHCYVVKQHDKHWPYLTCRETLSYAAELYDVVDKADLDALVDEIIRKMGMESCADTRNSALSGGQRRRLSIGVALLKQPTLLFLGELPLFDIVEDEILGTFLIWIILCRRTDLWFGCRGGE